jgi:hypothetical protein
MTREFYTELAELIKKHKLTLVTGTHQGLEQFSKSFEGNMFFVTDGTKSIHLRGGEKMQFESSKTIKLEKNRYRG